MLKPRSCCEFRAHEANHCSKVPPVSSWGKNDLAGLKPVVALDVGLRCSRVGGLQLASGVTLGGVTMGRVPNVPKVCEVPPPHLKNAAEI